MKEKPHVVTVQELVECLTDELKANGKKDLPVYFATDTGVRLTTLSIYSGHKTKYNSDKINCMWIDVG